MNIDILSLIVQAIRCLSEPIRSYEHRRFVVLRTRPERVAKDLAVAMNVNTNTLLQALRELRDEGLLEFRRSHGVRVSGTPQRGAVIAHARELLSFARQQDYPPEELITIIQALH